MDFKKYVVVVTMIPFLSGCLSDSEDFDPLANGDVSDVQRTSISQILPDVEEVVIEQGQEQQFFISAEAPFGRGITFAWNFDGDFAQVGEVGNYSITGAVDNIGSHTLIVEATDGTTSDRKEWAVKVNGPPVLTAISTGTQKVSVGSTIDISISATDPNSDALTYSWKLNGATSAYLTGTTATATLSGVDDIVGSVNITVDVSDGTASSSYSWTAEINYFPMACNQLTQGNICTYGGNPSVGDGLDPGTSQSGIRVGIIGIARDTTGGLDNYFYADNFNHVIWYWNQSGAAVTRLGVTIPANQMVRVAGSGEQSNGSEGIPALESALNSPRAVAYDESTGNLYIADYSNHLVRYIDSSGIVWNGLGSGASHADGGSVFGADCNNPADLQLYNSNIYVTCYAHHRVKRWDLTTDLAYNVLGTGGSGYSGDGGDPLAAQARRPFGIFVNSKGIFVTHYDRNRVRFINHPGAQQTFWGITIGGAGPGFASQVRTIMGSGTAGYHNSEQNPTALKVTTPTDVIEVNDMVFVTTIYSNRDRIYVGNNTGALATLGNINISINKAGPFATATAGYNGSGIDIDTARVNEPYRLAFNSDSNTILLADYNNRRVRYIDTTTWKMTNMVGSGWSRYGFVGDVAKPSMEQQFYYPSSTVWDPSERTLFFMDKSNARIRKIDAYGRISTALGKGASDPIVDQEIPSNVYTRFNADYSAAAETPSISLFSDGSLIYVDRYIIRAWNRLTSNLTIANIFLESDRVATIAGDYLSGAGNSADGPASTIMLDRPNGVAAYGSGTSRLIFYSDTRNHCIKQIDDSGNVTTLVGNVDGSNHCSDVAGNGPNASSSPLGYALNNPTAITTDSSGNLYIADTNNHRIRFLNRSLAMISIGTISVQPGEIATIVCNSGATGSSAENAYGPSVRCNRPSGVAINDGKFCFSNAYHHNVRCMNISDGKVSTVAGSPTSALRAGAPFGLEQEGITGTDARLRYPRGLSFDDNGDLYITDTYNHIIRKLKLSAD